MDVFTDVRFAGNPLAVVHDADAVTDELMLAFARETRLSETTFVQSPSEPGADYRNRILSPAGELPFAGHPSLGTAVAVARTQGRTGAVRFVQQSGVGLQPIDVELRGDQAHAAMLQEPAVFGHELDPAPAVLALGLEIPDAHPELPAQVVSTGLPHLILPLGQAQALGQIRPDSAAVDQVLADSGAFGLYAAWPDPERGAARTRLFARSAQVSEDPATGSAAGPLCAYLHRFAGCTRLEISQGVELGRPSRILTEVEGDRVRVGGQVVLVIEGRLRV